jgi:hypothetical protein
MDPVHVGVYISKMKGNTLSKSAGSQRRVGAQKTMMLFLPISVLMYYRCHKHEDVSRSKAIYVRLPVHTPGSGDGSSMTIALNTYQKQLVSFMRPAALPLDHMDRHAFEPPMCEMEIFTRSIGKLTLVLYTSCLFLT